MISATASLSGDTALFLLGVECLEDEADEVTRPAGLDRGDEVRGAVEVEATGFGFGFTTVVRTRTLAGVLVKPPKRSFD